MLYMVVLTALVVGATFLIGYALPSRTTISRSPHHSCANWAMKTARSSVLGPRNFAL